MEMLISNTADIKNYLHKLIVETNDLEILKKMKNYFLSINNTTDWWNTISEDAKQDIEIGLSQLDAGKKIEYKEIKQKADKLLRRI